MNINTARKQRKRARELREDGLPLAPAFASDDAEWAFWDTHSVYDFAHKVARDDAPVVLRNRQSGRR